MEAIVQALPTAIELGTQAVKVGQMIGNAVSKRKLKKKQARLAAKSAKRQLVLTNAKISRGKKTPKSIVSVASTIEGGKSTGRYSRKVLPNGDMVIDGSDYLGQVASQSNLSLGDILIEQSVTPLKIANTRLQNECRNFETYFFEKFAVVYCPTVAATSNGNFVDYYDMDILEVPDTDGGEANIRRAQSHLRHSNYQVWQKNSIEMPPPSDTQVKKYFNDDQGSDLRLSEQARYYLLAGANMNAGTYGFLEIHYRVKFTNPQQAYNPVSGQAAKLTGGGIFAPNDIMGANPIYDPQNSFKIGWSPSGLLLNRGSYWIVIAISGTDFTGFSVDPVGDVSATELFTIDTSTTVYTFIQATIPSAQGTIDFTVGPDPGATIIASQMFITLLPVGMTRVNECRKNVKVSDLVTVLNKLVKDLAPGREIDVLDLLDKPSKEQKPKLTCTQQPITKSVTTAKPDSTVFRTSGQVLSRQISKNGNSNN